MEKKEENMWEMLKKKDLIIIKKDEEIKKMETIIQNMNK